MNLYTGWRFAYPACGALRDVGRRRRLRRHPAKKHGAGMNLDTGWRFAYPAYGGTA
ncbi:hypothetical protein [Citrobacter sp. NCU1]|uniref:hypothetical protein n=1 Tax=Citrobacter sp. NCU1 TaxID=2026683 RepID=UPI001391F016|nr:hypothetical protein [Citrobacter sp. NCU1]